VFDLEIELVRGPARGGRATVGRVERRSSDEAAEGAMSAEEVSWLRVLALDALVTIGAALLWILDPAQLAHSAFGADPPDAAHLALTRKGGLAFLVVGLHSLGLVWREQAGGAALRQLQQLQLALDAGLLVLGVEQVLEHPTGSAHAAALAQIGVSLFRIGLRTSWLRRAAGRPGGRS
jgi:hypothetical protein